MARFTINKPCGTRARSTMLFHADEPGLCTGVSLEEIASRLARACCLHGPWRLPRLLVAYVPYASCFRVGAVLDSLFRHLSCVSREPHVVKRHERQSPTKQQRVQRTWCYGSDRVLFFDALLYISATQCELSIVSRFSERQLQAAHQITEVEFFSCIKKPRRVAVAESVDEEEKP